MRSHWARLHLFPVASDLGTVLLPNSQCSTFETPTKPSTSTGGYQEHGRSLPGTAVDVLPAVSTL